ncbi:hypothetical protein HHK36_003089 [Tetracentron sinense]|uniref:RING-type domain-containing protein n=1 Tax=Tetracentron sinense TaxID=13715 RepID=A0A834ZSN9_TETSI|nr:hypothetical protein HHK36_003089 [Tetracentron sinense]
MGSACCVAAKDTTLPNRISTETLQRNIIYSPSWSFQWDNRGRVAGEVENATNEFSHGISRNVGLEIKGGINVETGNVSDRGNPLENFQTLTSQKSPIHEGTAGNLVTPASEEGNGACDSASCLHLGAQNHCIGVVPALKLRIHSGTIIKEETLAVDGSSMKIAEALAIKMGLRITVETDLSMESNLSTEVKDLAESTEVADPSAYELSSPVPSTLSLSTSKLDPLLSHSHPLLDESTPSRRARHSPGHQLLRQVSSSRFPGLKSPNNNSVSEGRPSFVLSLCSNDLTIGSQGGSSDGWSMRTFSELVASSQRERWSFDSDSLGSGCGKITRSSSRLSASPSIDPQTCGVCLKVLTERSSWSSQKFIASNELSVVAVLVCGHVYHAECLENLTPESDRCDPPCPVCLYGDVVSKISRKALRVEADKKAKSNKIPRNQVVDSDVDGDSIVFDHQKNAGREGKGPKMGQSSSMRSSFGRPFLRRHFSFGLKSTRSLSVDNSERKKGFWARYR